MLPEHVKKTGDPQADAEKSAEEQALGRSRGGSTTKIHMICDAGGNPLMFTLTPGNIHDSTAFDALLMTVLAYIGSMKWSRRLKWVICDKGYDCKRIADLCIENKLLPVIPKRKKPNGEEREDPDFDKKKIQRTKFHRALHWVAQRKSEHRYSL